MNNPRRPDFLAIVTLALILGAAPLSRTGAAAQKDALGGVYSLYVALKGLDFEVPPFVEFAKAVGAPEANGESLARLAKIAEANQAHTLAVVTTPKKLQLRRERFACIAQLQEGRFALITGVDRALAQLIEPPNEKSIPVDTLGSAWPGTALLLSKEPLAPEDSLREPWPSWPLWAAAAVAVVLGVGVWWWRRRG